MASVWGPLSVPRGIVDVVIADSGGNFVDADASGSQGVGVKLYADGVLLRAIDLHLRHAIHHGYPLGQHGFAVLVQDRHGQGRAGQRQIQNRLIGGINLAKGRRRRHSLGQTAKSAGNGGLHILRGGIDIAAQDELQGDPGGALRTDGTHGVDTGDGREFLLQRRGHGGGHCFRIGAGEIGADADRGKVHRRQIAHGKEAITDKAGKDDAHHAEHRHDRDAG